VVQKLRSLEPPVAEQLGVVGRDDQRLAAQHAAQVSRLRLPVQDEMAGVRSGLAGRPLRHVRLLCAEVYLAGDAEILDAEVAAYAVTVQVRLDVIVITIKAEVAVELAVVHVAWITDLGAPDLLAGFNIARKRGDARRR